MKKVVVVSLMAVLFGLVVNAGALADPYREPATGLVFPDELATLQRGSVTDCEKESPGLGVSIGYNKPGITVTLYVYSMGMKTIPADLSSPVMMDHFEQVSGDVVKAGKLGYYANVKRLKTDGVCGDENKKGTKWLHTSYSYTQRGTDRLSDLYLTSFKNQYVKIRFTYNADVQADAEKTRAALLAAFEKMLTYSTDTRKP